MSRAIVEPWICGSCRSLNQQTASRCYKCRTPRALVEADPTKLVVAGEGHSAAVASVTKAAQSSALGGYKESWAFAGLAQCMLIGTGILAILYSIVGADILGMLVNGDTAGAKRDANAVGWLTVVLYGFAAVTLVSWAAWLSRVVSNVPKVGLGWPNVTPTAAFIENFLPGWNLFRVPAIVRDVLHRLEPNGGRGNSLLVAAWLGLVGGVVLPRILGIGLGFVVDSVEQLLSVGFAINQVGLGLTLAGIVFLVLLIRRIEKQMEAAADKVAPSAPVQPSAQPTAS
jgi:hypothetical protein